MKYYDIEEDCYNPSNYFLRPKYEKLRLHGTTGSYNILPARLLNLSYAEYLRMCRDVYGAELIGKGTIYVVPYYDSKEKAREIAKMLDKRINEIFISKS